MAAEQRVRLMAPLPFIQVGVGNRGAQILSDFATSGERFRPVGFVDVDPAFVDAARALHPGAAGHASLEAALGAEPDAVVVLVTPARFHGDMVRAALRANRHVWVEKPLTYDYDEARALADLARQQGRAVVVGNQYQYHPLERQLGELVRSGRYGKAFHVSYIHHRHRPQMRAFTGPFPALWEQGVHSLNSILAILGNPALETVYALGQKPPSSAYNSDTVTNLLTGFADGAQAHLLVTFDSQRSDWAIRVECERAALLLVADGWDRNRIEVVAGEELLETILPAPPADSALADPIAAFHTAIAKGVEVPTSIAVNLKTIQWIDAAVRSLESGEVVRFGEQAS
jgi:predicted dehydrogenase